MRKYVKVLLLGPVSQTVSGARPQLPALDRSQLKPRFSLSHNQPGLWRFVSLGPLLSNLCLLCSVDVPGEAQQGL